MISVARIDDGTVRVTRNDQEPTMSTKGRPRRFIQRTSEAFGEADTRHLKHLKRSG